MSALGLPEALKDMARNSKPKVDISKDGSTWTIKTTVGEKVNETKYPENQEIETTNIMGQTTKATLSVDGSALVEVQKFGDVEMQTRRALEGDMYVVTMTAKGTEAKVKFTKA